MTTKTRKKEHVEEQAEIEELDLTTEVKANLDAISKQYRWLNGDYTVEDLPAPTVTSLVPNTKVNGSANFTLTVNGANYISGSTIYWGTTALATNYISPTGLSATITTALLGAAGTVQVKVQNGTLASGTSAFTVT